MKRLTWLIWLIWLTPPAFALDDEANVHFMAHAGTSFALETMFYGINKKEFGMSRGESLGLAFAETMALGLLYKVAEGTPANTGRAMIENAVGAGAAIGLNFVFEF